MSNVIDMSAAPEPRKERPSTAVALSEVTPMQMVAIAVQQGADIAKIEKLMDLQERWERRQACKAYVAAMAAFKADPPTILKNKHVSFALKTGGRIEYNHATHDEVTNKIIVAMAPHGLSHNWTVRQEGGMVFVKCTITHELGYSESTEMFGPPDTTGTKSVIQAIASTTTLLQRYTLLSISGLTSQEITANDADDLDRGSADAIPEMPLDMEARIREYAERFVATLDISDQAVIDVHNELNTDQRFYRDVWSHITSSARSALKQAIERAKVNS